MSPIFVHLLYFHLIHYTAFSDSSFTKGWSGLTKNHNTMAKTTNTSIDNNVDVHPIRSAKTAATSGLTIAPTFPQRFIQPETDPEKLRPMSVAEAQLITIERPTPAKQSDIQKMFIANDSAYTAKTKEIPKTTKPKMAIVARAINLDLPVLKILLKLRHQP